MLQKFLDILFPPRKAEQLVRDATLADVLKHLSPVPLSLGGAALLPYRTPLVQALIKEAKFKGNTKAQQLLSEVLREYLQDWLSDREGFEERKVLLLPVPLSKKRYRARGYNQTEEIVKRVGGWQHATHVLKRTRDTAPQTSLGKKERQKNVEGAFRASGVDSSFLYIVVDDVSTTGATLSATVEALTLAGAVHVVPIALAY